MNFRRRGTVPRQLTGDLTLSILPGISADESAAVSLALEQVFRWLEAKGIAAQAWYLRAKRPYEVASKAVRACGVAFAIAAGLIPVVALIEYPSIDGEWAFAALIAGAGLILLDATFGLTKTWCRHMITATAIAERLTEFQLRWVQFSLDGQSKPEEAFAFLEKFSQELSRMLGQETEQWAEEFTKGFDQLRNRFSSGH
jgi:hypothetical protein